VIWVGVWEAVAALAGSVRIGQVPLESIAAAASPIRAILAAAHPHRDTLGLFAAPDTWFAITALVLTALLNGLAIVRLRVWNPGREVRPQAEDEDGGEPLGARDVEAARAAHVDARVRQIDQQSREVWDNPVLWREMRTWAYGKKVLVIKAVYWLLVILAALAVYWTIRSGAAHLRASETIVPAAAYPLAPFFLISLVIVNALAVTSITNERDGGSLDLLLVTDLTPREFLFGKMLGVAYVTWEMLAAPLALCLVLFVARALTIENLFYLIIGLLVMDLFVITLGVHAGMNYANSKTAIGISLGSVFFLFLGVVTLILFMISFSSSYQVQLGPFLAFIVGGSVGLFVMLGYRNPSAAIGWASLLLPLLTFLAITDFLVDHVTAAFFITAGTYGFTTAAMLVPALYEFDIAMGRAKAAEEE
jgi:ABC-type transport system involved in multi-copper enzyme maturation permease subunit